MKMASSPATLLYFTTLITILSLPHCAPTELQVGGKSGWHVPRNNDTSFYALWAADNRFHVGDSLCFAYRNDSVMVVDKYGYYHCSTSKPIYVFRDEAKTVIKLDRPGPFYFISGAPDHCKNGQRLEVDVMSNEPHPADDHYAPAPAPSSASVVESLLPVEIFAIAAGLAYLASHY